MFKEFRLGAFGEDLGGIDEKIEGWCCEGKRLPSEGEAELTGGAGFGSVIECRLAARAQCPAGPDTKGREGLERGWGRDGHETGKSTPEILNLPKR